MMRFKGYSCNYFDHPTWAIYETVAKNNNRGMFDFTNNLGPNMMEGIDNAMHQRCAYSIGQWAIFDITFGIEIDCDIRPPAGAATQP